MGAGRLIAAAEPTVTSWTVRELLWVSMYDEVRDDERRRVIEEMSPERPLLRQSLARYRRRALDGGGALTSPRTDVIGNEVLRETN